eukprot:9480320-Pyramimonas_sp.AAC.1
MEVSDSFAGHEPNKARNGPTRARLWPAAQRPKFPSSSARTARGFFGARSAQRPADVLHRVGLQPLLARNCGAPAPGPNSSRQARCRRAGFFLHAREEKIMAHLERDFRGDARRVIRAAERQRRGVPRARIAMAPTTPPTTPES